MTIIHDNLDSCGAIASFNAGDPETNSVNSQFAVLITLQGGAQLRYENANCFYLKDRLFHKVYVYMSGAKVLV